MIKKHDSLHILSALLFDNSFSLFLYGLGSYYLFIYLFILFFPPRCVVHTICCAQMIWLTYYTASKWTSWPEHYNKPTVYILEKVNLMFLLFAKGCSVGHKNTIIEDLYYLSLSAILLREAWAVIMEIGGRIWR